LRNRLKQGKVYRPDKVEQALGNFFQKGNLAALRELALRLVADEVSDRPRRTAQERHGTRAAPGARHGLHEFERRQPACHPDRRADRGRLGARWYAVFVETPRESVGRIRPKDREALVRNIALAEALGATVVRVKADRPRGLIAFARREGITTSSSGRAAIAAGRSFCTAPSSTGS